MSLVFYYAPRSTAVTVNWALQELDIPYEKVDIDLAARDQDKSGYRALNPNGKVPLVVHDGVPIFESAAIMIHLGETFGVERGLFPAAGLERAQALKWLVWANVTLVSAAVRLLENTLESIPASRKNAHVAEDAQAQIESLFGILDGELKEKRFLVGGEFSLVDLHLASILGWIDRFGPAVAQRPNLSRWHQRCVSRPSHAKSLAA